MRIKAIKKKKDRNCTEEKANIF